MDELSNRFEELNITDESAASSGDDYDGYADHNPLRDAAEAALYGNIDMDIPGYARPMNVDKVCRRLTF